MDRNLHSSQKIGKWHEEFLQRYYLWCLSASAKEHENGFPHVRAIQSTAAFVFADYASVLTDRESLLFRTGLIKRMNRIGMGLAGESLSEQEALLTQRYLDRLTLDSTMESGAWRSKLSLSREDPPSQRLLRDTLLKRLNPTLGSPVKLADNFSEWRYRKIIKGFCVDTYIATGRGFQMSYHHTIGIGSARPAHTGVSILEWLGIAGQTSWDLLKQSEVDAAVQTLIEAIVIFLDGVNDLLHGITPDGSEIPSNQSAQVYIVRVRRHLPGGLTAVALEGDDGAVIADRSLELRIPTRIIPEDLRKVGSRLLVTEYPESPEAVDVFGRLKIDRLL